MNAKKGKLYRYGEETMSTSQARNRFPNPKFFDRAHERMSADEIRRITVRNIAEIRYWLDVEEKVATGRHAGRPLPKRTQVAIANRFHDWRVGMTVMSGGLGQPFLWEE